MKRDLAGMRLRASVVWNNLEAFAVHVIPPGNHLADFGLPLQPRIQARPLSATRGAMEGTLRSAWSAGTKGRWKRLARRQVAVQQLAVAQLLCVCKCDRGRNEGKTQSGNISLCILAITRTKRR